MYIIRYVLAFFAAIMAVAVIYSGFTRELYFLFTIGLSLLALSVGQMLNVSFSKDIYDQFLNRRNVD